MSPTSASVSDASNRVEAMTRTAPGELILARALRLRRLDGSLKDADQGFPASAHCAALGELVGRGIDSTDSSARSLRG